METKENPKLIQARKEGKAPLEYLVTSVWPEDAVVHKHGADKYGRLNWRVDPILYSTYKAAMLRHMVAFFDKGEDIDPDSGVSHLAHIRACAAVLRDAQLQGSAIDDRNVIESKSLEVEEGKDWREGTVWSTPAVEPKGEYNPDDKGHPENVHQYMRELRLKDD